MFRTNTPADVANTGRVKIDTGDGVGLALPVAAAPLAHTHPVSDVTGLAARLDALEHPDPVDLGDTHLDTVLVPGIYVCRTSANAQVALGYPYEGVPGTLHVLPWNPALPRVIAVFYPWSSRPVAKRTSNSNGTWGGWNSGPTFDVAYAGDGTWDVAETPLQALTDQGRLPTAAVAHVQEMTTEATWFKGELSSGDTLDSIADGSYRVTSGSVATDLGLPAAAHGVVESWTNDSGSWVFQSFSTVGGSHWTRYAVSGTWREWMEPRPFWSRGTLNSASNVDTLAEGSYRVASPSAAGAMGLPEAQHGLVESWNNGPRSWIFQRFTTVSGSRWTRFYAGGQWREWAALDTTDDLPEPDMSRLAITEIRSGSLLDYGAPENAGYYGVLSPSVTGQPPGLEGSYGILEVFPLALSSVLRFTPYNGPGVGSVWTCVRYNSGAYSDWVKVGPSASASEAGEGALTMSRGVQRQSQALAIFHARMMKRDTEPIPIVFAGDSETRGEGATSNATRYVDRLVAYLQGKYPSASGSESTVQDRTGGAPFSPRTGPGIHGYCMGRGGTQADTYLTDADTVNIAAIDPAMIIHQVALNDYARRRPIAQYRADLIHRIDHLNAALTRPCVHVFSLTYPRQDVTNPDPEWHEYGDALRSIAAERPENVAFLDMSPAFAAMGIPGTDPFGLLVADQIHTNDDGYEMMARCVAIGIEEL